jgi:protein-S-isoprenylcysteine O-methyltransferase Ste14
VGTGAPAAAGRLKSSILTVTRGRLYGIRAALFARSAVLLLLLLLLDFVVPLLGALRFRAPEPAGPSGVCALVLLVLLMVTCARYRTASISPSFSAVAPGERCAGPWPGTP